MSPFTIIKGKLFCGGVKVPLQWGNTDQIRFINAMQRKREEGELVEPVEYRDDDRIDVEFRSHACNAYCCGIYRDCLDPVELEDEVIPCRQCGQKHIVKALDSAFGGLLKLTALNSESDEVQS